jgi:hypothetical protein
VSNAFRWGLRGGLTFAYSARDFCSPSCGYIRVSACVLEACRAGTDDEACGIGWCEIRLWDTRGFLGVAVGQKVSRWKPV